MARTTPPFISLIHSSVQPYGRETNNSHKYKKKKEEKDSPTASILPQNIRIKHKYFTFTQSTVYAAYLTAEKRTTDQNGSCAGESLQQNGGLYGQKATIAKPLRAKNNTTAPSMVAKRQLPYIHPFFN